MGLLVIRGSLRVTQFWPKGGADADTATVEVVLEGNRPFIYVDEQGGRHPSRVFEKAESIGRSGRRPVVRFNKRLDANVINVRLQGIDAPELHFQPQVTGSAGHNGKFRQSLGETCSHALHDYLSKISQNDLPCEILSRVRKPNEVCDTYGRIVGNLVLTIDGTRVDVNHWLIREGWALPGLYNSMTKNEIRQLLADHDAAREDNRGMFSGPYVKKQLATFNPNRRYRKGPASFTAFSDKGTVNFPKFFRRQADHHVRRAIGENVPAGLLAYIATKRDDIAIDIRRFLNHTSPTSGADFKRKFEQLATFVKNGRYPLGPEVVFWEADSKLVRAGTNKPITAW